MIRMLLRQSVNLPLAPVAIASTLACMIARALIAGWGNSYIVARWLAKPRAAGPEKLEVV